MSLIKSGSNNDLTTPRDFGNNCLNDFLTEIADEITLTPAQKNQKKLKYRAFIAVRVDGVRLIDNIQLN